MAINIEVPDGAFDLDKMGVMMVKSAQSLASLEGASKRIRDNWNTIKNWLELSGAELTSSDEDRIGAAWKAYLAIGVAPSHKLQPAFDDFSQQCKDEGYDFKPDKPPASVIRAFDGVLATDDEIDEKRKDAKGINKGELKRSNKPNALDTSKKGWRGELTPSLWLLIIVDVVGLGVSLFYLTGSIFYVSFEYWDLGWGVSGFVMTACFSMNLYIIFLERTDELAMLSHNVKKARMEKDLHEIKSSILSVHEDTVGDLN